MYMYMYNLFEVRSPVFSLEAGIFSELNKRQITELYNYIITMRNHSKKTNMRAWHPQVIERGQSSSPQRANIYFRQLSSGLITILKTWSSSRARQLNTGNFRKVPT